MTHAEVASKNSVANISMHYDVVMQGLPHVRYLAANVHKKLPQRVELEDLVSSGVIGLLEAYKSFDGSKRAQFKTFAGYRIRGAILDSLRAGDWGKRSLRRSAREINEATARLETKLLRHPSTDEVAQAMNMNLDHLFGILAQIDGLLVVGQWGTISPNSTEELDLIESAPDLKEPNAFDLCLRGEVNKHLAKAVSALTKREQLILLLYYRDGRTLEEISIIVGLASSRVSQIRMAAMPKLRALLAHLREGGTMGSIGARPVV